MTKGVQDWMVAIAKVRDDFHRAVFHDRDLETALALVDDNCVLENLPFGSGARGRDGLAHYLQEDLLPHLPGDLEFGRVSRTGDRWRFVAEDLVSFTHDREVPWLVPGLAATHVRVEVYAVSIVTVGRAGLVISSHGTHWDHATLLAQLGAASAR